MFKVSENIIIFMPFFFTIVNHEVQDTYVVSQGKNA